MRKWTKTAGLLFLAASAVYSDPVSLADEATPGKPAPHAVAKPDVFAKVAPKTDDAFVAAPTTAASPAPAPAVEPEPVVVDQPAEKSTDAKSNAQVNVSDAGTVEIHVNDA